MYIRVFEETPESSNDTKILLQILIKQYECFELFDLDMYLRVCEELIANILHPDRIDHLNNFMNIGSSIYFFFLHLTIIFIFVEALLLFLSFLLQDF